MQTQAKTQSMHPRPRWGKTKSDKAPLGQRQGIRNAAKLAKQKDKRDTK